MEGGRGREGEREREREREREGGGERGSYEDLYCLCPDRAINVNADSETFFFDNVFVNTTVLAMDLYHRLCLSNNNRFTIGTVL